MFKMKSSQDWLMMGLVVLLIAYFVNEYKKTNNEFMDSRYFKYLKDDQAEEVSNQPVIYGKTDAKESVSATKCGNFVSSDLLPKTNEVVQSNDFAFAPNKDVKLLIKPTQSLIGVNTQGGSLRNPNLDIRSAPAIDKKDVSPWLNSTIGPDLYRRPLE